MKPSLDVTLYLLKGTLSVKRSAPYWAVLREYHTPMMGTTSAVLLFRAAVKFFSGMQAFNIATLQKIFRADLKLQPRAKTCWASDTVPVFEELQSFDTRTQVFL